MYFCIRDGRSYPNECTLQSCIDWALWSVIHMRNEYGKYCEVRVCSAETGELVYSIDTCTLRCSNNQRQPPADPTRPAPRRWSNEPLRCSLE